MPPNNAPISMNHIGFWATPDERDRVVRFFSELLEFELISLAQRKGGGERLILRNNKLQCIEILTADDVETLKEYPLHPKRRVAGIVHLCFEVPDLTLLREKVAAMELPIILEVPGDGSYGQSELGIHRILFVQAAGNVTVELFEFQEKRFATA